MKYNKTYVIAVGLGALLSACGNSVTAISAPSTSVVASTSNSNPTPNTGAGATVPGAFGTIASVSVTTLEVQNPTTGQTTVTYSSTTILTKTVSASASALVAGVCITAVGTPTTPSSTSGSFFGRPVTATSVTLSQPTNGKCSLGNGVGGFGGRRSHGGASGAARFRGGANFAVASGVVSSVANGVAQVTATNRSTESTVVIPVTLTSTTTYLERTAASASDLVVGQCARAVGAMNSIGAVAATRIAISAPTANGCLPAGRFGFGAPQGGSLG